MIKIVRFSKDLTVDCIDEDDQRDYRSYESGDTLQISSVSEVSDSFVSITLSNGILLLDIPRNAVTIVWNMIQDLNPSVQSTQSPQTRVTLKDTIGVTCDECENPTFSEAMMMRRVSRILTGTPKDSYVPVPIFVCVACGHVNDEFLPAELKTTQSPRLVAAR